MIPWLPGKPTEPGWYWLVNGSAKIAIEVKRNDSGQLKLCIVPGLPILELDHWPGRFAGPLPEPEVVTEDD